MVGITTPECRDESKGNETSSGAGMEIFDELVNVLALCYLSHIL
jgi:hypothetical protein